MGAAGGAAASPESLDPDMLDERARALLNYVGSPRSDPACQVAAAALCDRAATCRHFCPRKRFSEARRRPSRFRPAGDFG